MDNYSNEYPQTTNTNYEGTLSKPNAVDLNQAVELLFEKWRAFRENNQDKAHTMEVVGAAGGLILAGVEAGIFFFT